MRLLQGRSGRDRNLNLRGRAVSQRSLSRSGASGAVDQPKVVHLLGGIGVLGYLAAEIPEAHARLVLGLAEPFQLLRRLQGRLLVRRHRKARLIRLQQLLHARRLGLGLGAARALGLQHFLEEGLRILRRVCAVDIFHLLHQPPAVGGDAAAAHMYAAQGAL